MREEGKKNEHRQPGRTGGKEKKRAVAKPHSNSYSYSHSGHFIENSDHFQHTLSL